MIEVMVSVVVASVLAGTVGMGGMRVEVGVVVGHIGVYAWQPPFILGSQPRKHGPLIVKHL